MNLHHLWRRGLRRTPLGNSPGEKKQFTRIVLADLQPLALRCRMEWISSRAMSATD